uniref:DAZ-associated protein 2 n=1 Tax=Clastoptera arizonana TaxID=38151 RepID=A0A1B6E3X8_9HEMI
MSEKKAFPGAPQPPPAGYVPAPPHPAAAYAVPAAAGPYGVFPGQAQLYAAAQGPPPTYDQALAHPAIVGQQMYQPGAAAAAAAAAASMYAAQGYPGGYLGYPAAAYSPMHAYYPALAAAYSYPQHQLRPTIMVPNGYDGGARFDGIAQQVLPPAPPGVPPSPAQLAAMAGHNVTLSQKKGSYLTGASEGGYTFW